MNNLLQDLKFGLRMVVKNPGITSLAVVALAFGIGLTTISFSIVYGAVIRGLPFDQSEELLHIERSNPSQGIESYSVSIHDFTDWRNRQTSFEDIAAFRMGTVNIAGGEGRPERFSGSFIQPAAFRLLGVQPVIGRVFAEEEDRAGGEAVIIIGHGMWQDRFDSDPNVLGQTVRANGETMTVIGVMPDEFQFPVGQDVWLPLRMSPADQPRDDGFGLEVFGRLKEGITQDMAELEFATIAGALAQEYPETNEGVMTIIKPYTEEFIGSETAGILYSMLGAVSLVLLIACANVANLLLARAAARTKEIAIRTAMGASRGRLIMQFLSEALVLAMLGGVAGTGIAYIGITAFDRAVQATDPPFWLDFKLDPVALGFIAAVSIMAALIAGVLPALQATGAKISDVLKDEGRGSSSLKIGKFARTLVVSEIAFSAGLLAVSGLMIKGIVKLSRVDLGFESEAVLTARVGLFETDYPEEEDRRRFWDELQARVAAIPGVQTATLTSVLPGQGACCWRFAIEGSEYEETQDMPLSGRAIVTPSFFDVFDLAAVSGRVFESGDLDGAVPVAVVNQSFASLFFADGDALGKRVRTGGIESDNDWQTIVGIVPDHGMSEVEDPEKRPEGMYVPLDQNIARFMTISMKTVGDPKSLVPQLREAVAGVDPNLPIYNVRTMDEVIAEETWFFGVFGTLFSVVGAVALFMASVGLYGVMSFSVANRTQEVGIRMALGAQRSSVLKMIVKQGLVQIGIGLVLGTGLGLAMTRGMEQLYFQVEPWDPTVFAGIGLILGLTGLAATLIPAVRATKVDPMEALRYE